jgi:hypothetical protein
MNFLLGLVSKKLTSLGSGSRAAVAQRKSGEKIKENQKYPGSISSLGPILQNSIAAANFSDTFSSNFWIYQKNLPPKK